MANKFSSVSFSFNSKAYIDTLVKFLKEKMHSEQFRGEILRIYSDEIYEAHERGRVGNPDWIREMLLDAKDFMINDGKPKKSGSILAVEVGLPPKKYYQNDETLGLFYRPFVIEYGIGSRGRFRKTPLYYHNLGELTWGRPFDIQYTVTKKNAVQPWQPKKGDPPTRPGDEMPDGMNQAAQPFMENVRIRVTELFEDYTEMWVQEFAEQYPISAFIEVKQK